ncbi:hypothetical protein [Streptomyces sp. NPDC020983]|uniref:hypothetical protein n=1 Tax=Streptomyces sp. NPDC020983 TaxID=3365106 RepID=UPI0037940F9D
MTAYSVTWTDSATCTQTTSVVTLPDTTADTDVPAALAVALLERVRPGVRVRVDHHEVQRVPPQTTRERRQFMDVNGW